jgi:uncharacterized membrane protein
MRLALFTAVAAATFLAADAAMIPLVMRPLFKAALGDQMLDDLRLGPAALFYVVHIGGLAAIAGRTAAAAGPRAAFRDGAILGLVAYSCYEMTSWTIMRDWHAGLVAADVAWGAAISGFSAWTGALAVSRVRP